MGGQIYHHCTDLENIVYGEIKADPKYSDEDLLGSYKWLEGKIGFFPLFLAVGETEEDIRMTGYQNQWRRFIATRNVGRREDGTYIQKNVYRKKGEFPNYVLFSFNAVDGIFTDYDLWCDIICYIRDGVPQYDYTDCRRRQLFKPSWPKSKWLRKAKKDPHSVQLVTQKLYLPDADRIWVRNKKTQRLMGEKGFENVEVRRILVGD